MSVLEIVKIGIEDICTSFDIKENLYQKYVESEILKDNLLRPLMEKRDNNMDWTKETPLGGAGTTLNGCALYCLVRHFGMTSVLETGVSGGYYTAFMLAALNKNNNEGELVSLELSDNKTEVGKLVPKFKLNARIDWDLKLGESSLEWFEKRRRSKVTHNSELYSHDSLHTMSHMLKELKEFKESTADRFFIFIDDEKSDNFWNRCLQTNAFKKQGYNVRYVSGQESRLNGHLGGFIKFEKV